MDHRTGKNSTATARAACASGSRRGLNRATFTNLDPGTHLPVQGHQQCRRVGTTKEGATLSIVRPSWWALMVPSRGGDYALPGDLHETIARDLGSTLSSVALYSTVARKAGDPRPEANAMLDCINEEHHRGWRP